MFNFKKSKERSTDYSWDDLATEFRALGGVLDNVEQRHGEHGLGLFPVNPANPVKIQIPESLLVPTKWVQVIDGDLEISEESGLEQGVREFFMRYQRNFSWGRGGRSDAEDWFKRVNSLSEKNRQVVLEKLGIGVSESTGEENALLARYINSRSLRHRDSRVIMPIIELINHSPYAQGYDFSSGDLQVSGTFENEIYVNYGSRCDPLHRYRGYGFVCPENNAYSQAFTLHHPDMTLVVKQDYMMAQGKKGVDAFLPVVEHSPGTVTLSFLMVGSITNPRVPRSVFRRILPHLSHDIADELFERVVHANIDFLVDALQMLDDEDSRMGRELREVIHLQLKTIGSCFGVRDLDAL